VLGKFRGVTLLLPSRIVTAPNIFFAAREMAIFGRPSVSEVGYEGDHSCYREERVGDLVDQHNAEKTDSEGDDESALFSLLMK